ncbi:MAG: efflux RND transporter permease subunit [Pirellulaceae bacterium]|nr:efflux RND transporter permease subunit [Pirellulaceae bacterium]
MIRLALTNPYLVVVTALATLVLGVRIYLFELPADLLPQFETSAVQIVTFYPGMPPEVMEKDIMSRLQRWTGQSVGIEHQEAKAMQGVCIVKDFFREGISMDTAMSQVTSYAMSDMFYLPPGTIPPMVMPFDPTANVPLCLVVVTNPQMDEQELYDIAYYELRNKLQSIQGVIAPAVYGGKLRRILAYVDRERLEAFGLSLMDVQRALLKQNVLIPAGSIKVGNQEFQIFTNANVDHIEELNEVPIKEVDGVPVLMRDVGTVKNASQIQTNIVRVNGSRKAYIPIYRQPGANTIEIVKQINRQLRNIEERLKVERSEDPKMATLSLSVAMDQSVGVVRGNQTLQIAAGLGALLAGAVVFVFLRSVRYTLIVVLAIPLAILASVFGMYFTGDTINAMTLGGIALAIGILVDQSIVVLENVVRHAHLGKKPRQAALDGATEVALPMLVATITFAIVFFPVVFLSGLAKFLFMPLAVAASIAIFASYVIAITLVPAYCAKFLGVGSISGQQPQSGWLTTAYRATLQGLMPWRYLIIFLAFVGFGASLFVLSTKLGQELFPQVDSGQVQLFVRMPTGTKIEMTERTIREVEQEIIKIVGQPDPDFALGREEIPESNLQLLVSNIGVLLDWPAAYTPNSGVMDTFMLVQTKSKPEHPDIFQYTQQLRKVLNEKFPNVEFSFDTGGMLTAALNMGEPSPIHFQIQATNLETAQEVAQRIVGVANGVPGSADVRIAQRIDYPILEVEMDRDLAVRQGLTPDEVMKNLVAATNSSINFQPSFWIDKRKGNHYFFGVQYWEEELDSIDTLLNIPVGSGAGGPRRLGNVAEIRRTKGPAVINHRNISRVTDVYVNVLSGYDVGGVVSEIEQRLEALGAQAESDERGELYRLGRPKIDAKTGETQEIDLANEPFRNADLYKGITFRMMGEVLSMRESFTQFTGGLMLAAILVYLVMVAQFRSFIDPFIVLLTVPLGFIGVVIALVVTQTNLSIMAFMGIIMMVGIVVEYSIVLVDFANHRLAAGRTVKEAILEAAQVRLRPILMTSFTTWLALLPMAIGAGGGSANAPLARTIIGGVIGATVLSLLVVPCLYVVMKRPPRSLDDDRLGETFAEVQS